MELINQKKVEKIHIKDGKFTADDLRDIADAMDNPNLMPKYCKTLDQFVERMGLI